MSAESNRPRRQPLFTHRFRAYSRWPADQQQRIAAAKSEFSLLRFFHLAGAPIPDDVMRHANSAADRLQADQVPAVEWE